MIDTTTKPRFNIEFEVRGERLEQEQRDEEERRKKRETYWLSVEEALRHRVITEQK